MQLGLCALLAAAAVLLISVWFPMSIRGVPFGGAPDRAGSGLYVSGIGVLAGLSGALAVLGHGRRKTPNSS
jgi:hypothetical protein